MLLKGDYSFGRFSHPKGITDKDLQNADETHQKVCPGDLQQKLWTAGVYYSHLEPIVESAITGFDVWRKTSIEKRILCLKEFQKQVRSRRNEIAEAIALETGKPLWESETEADALSSKVDVTISDSLQRITTQTMTQVMPKIDGHIYYRPLGPTLIIGPFNFPCHLANGQILSSLLAGNSIIFKPSEKTMYSGQLLVECLAQAGFPDGVINLAQGTVHTASELVKNTKIKGVFFTGSKNVGLSIVRNTATQLDKLVALELGGKNSTIVHKDTNQEHALVELFRASFLTSGQRCTSTSNIFIHKDIEQEFMAKFKELSEKIIVDHPTKFKVKPFMGPLIDERAVIAYDQYCALAKSEGEAFLAPSKPTVDFEGHYCGPSIYYINKNVDNAKSLKEEIFGPSCTFVPYTDIEEAIKLSNISEYGLAASIFTKDKSIYELCLRDLDAGLVNLNRSTVGASARLPFGGVKFSGNFHPAAVSMIDHCVSTHSSLETLDDTSSKLTDLSGLK